MQGTDAWKAPRDCACGRAATIGYETCAPCRVAPLLARHLPAHVGAVLDERQAQLVERALREAEESLAVARTRLALAAGAPTHRRVEHGDRVALLGPARGEG